MLPGGSHKGLHDLGHVSCGLDLYYTDPAQHHRTTDDLDRNLCDVWNLTVTPDLSNLDHRLVQPW